MDKYLGSANGESVCDALILIALYSTKKDTPTFLTVLGKVASRVGDETMLESSDDYPKGESCKN